MFVFVLISKLLLNVDDLGAGLYLPVWKKIRQMTRSYSASNSKTLQFTAHENCT